MAFPSLTLPPNIFNRLSSFRERYGASNTVYKTIDVLLQKAFLTHVHTVVWLELKSVERMQCIDPQFTFRFLTPEEIESFAADPSYFIDPSLAAGVRGGKEVCFAALSGDRLAAFGCYTLEYVPPAQAAGAAMSFPVDVAYM